MSAPSQVDLIAIIKCQAYVRAFLERKNYKWISTPSLVIIKLADNLPLLLLPFTDLPIVFVL